MLAAAAPQQDSPANIVAQMWAQYAKFLSQQNAEALANLYAADARLMESGLDDIVGRMTIRDVIKQAFEQRTRPIDARIIPREVIGYDGVIYDQGDYIETLAPAGQPRRAVDKYGRYFAVWAEQPDGSWKISRLYLAPKQQRTR